jgi:hypothetical protein
MSGEKGSGVPKPGDVFIGVIDLFAVLIPCLGPWKYVVSIRSVKGDMLYEA